MDANNQNNKCYITFDLIQKSLINDPEGFIKSLKDISIDNIINFSKKFESIYSILFVKKKNSYKIFKRNIKYFAKYSIKTRVGKFKKNIYLTINPKNSLLYFIIPILKIFVENKYHKKIRKIILILIKLWTEKIIPYEVFIITIEFILNLLIYILKSNNDSFYYINDEPFNLINDIIISLISYPDKIKIENSNSYILTDILNLFDKYLFYQFHTNIILTETPIWLKLLEIKFFNPINHNEIYMNKNDISINNQIEIQKKLYSFLNKIYKFSMKCDYIENIIIKNSILDLRYYLNALNFLMQLFMDEIESIPLNDFKIKDCIFIQKNKYIYFENINPIYKSKPNEISIIFSFKISKIEINKSIDIVEILDIKKRSILKLYINEKGILILTQSQNYKLDTKSMIKENVCYFLCITIINSSIKSSELNLFINSETNNYNTKINNLDFSKEFSLALGKNNYIGFIGEFLIINKALNKKNVSNLFNLKEDYANNLRKFIYEFKIFPKRIKLKYKIDYNNSKEHQNAKKFFKQLGYEIIFEFNPNDILYNKLKNKYLDIDDLDFLINNNSNITPGKSEIRTNSIGINNNDISNNNKIKNNSLLSNKEHFNLFKNFGKMNYSYDLFYKSNGIDFLSFQLYNIFSQIKENKLLNLYLYETLSFIMKLFTYNEISYMNSSPKKSEKLKTPLKSKKSEDLEKSEQPEKQKLESEMIVFFLSLLISLINKKQKEKFYLDNNVLIILNDISNYFNRNRLINERNILLSILLDIDYYRNKEDIFQNQKLFNILKKELEEKNNDNRYIFNKEFLYKILSLDFCFENNEIKHKFLIELISGFITFDEKCKKDNNKFCELIQKEFIMYFLSLKNEKKIYHYLKIIYFNFDNIKEYLKNNFSFIDNINQKPENINIKHCKYCAYNQVLYYLINQEIINLNDDEQGKSFHFYPKDYMLNPSILFLKCFFSQILALSNENRVKFIKTNSEPIYFIFALNKPGKEVLNYENFQEKFDNIIVYIKFLIGQMDNKDANSIDKIIFSFNFISTILKKEFIREISVKNNEVNNKEIKQKNEIIKNRYKLQDILSEEYIKNFFELYINFNYNQAIEEIKNFVNISFDKVIFPFYFWFVFEKSVIIQNNIINTNNYELVSHIVDEFIKRKITYDLNHDAILIQNNVALLICIYNLIVKNNEEINPELEAILFLFLNHLKDNNFFYSKYVFDINIKPNKEHYQDVNEKKFVIEMVCDIYFHFYEKNQFYQVYECLIKNIFVSTKFFNIYKIDDQFFLNEKNRDKDYIFYNKKFLANIAKGEDRQDIIFSVYFLEYLLKKLHKYKKILKDNKNKSDDPIVGVMESMQLLLNNVIQLFNQYSNKKSYYNKNLQKINAYKSYIDLIDYIKGKYKSKKFSLEKLIEYYKKTTSNKEGKFKRKEKRNSTLGNTLYNANFGINRILKHNEFDFNKIYEDKDNTYASKTSFPKIIPEERKNKSFSHISSRRTSFSEICGFNEISSQNDSEENETINKKNYQNFEKIKSQKIPNFKFPITMNKPQNSEKSFENNQKNNKKENYLKEKLNEINIPFFHYKKFFPLSDSNTMKQLFNPKEYYIWNKFSIILKKIIFSQKKFIHVSNLFKMKFRNQKLAKSSNEKNRNFELKYPIKTKNFICDDYYRPFTKPDLNFFNNKLLHITHYYLNSKFLNENIFDIDKINKIEFTRMLPYKTDDNSDNEIRCEIVNDNGSYFGYLYINHAFLLFVSANDKDPRRAKIEKNYENIKDELFYLYSYFLEERIRDKNKYIIIFNSEIKEIVRRRFCFNYIGYEIFLKNNKSYLLNFFNLKNVNDFAKCLILKLEENKPKKERSNHMKSMKFMNISSQDIWPVNINEKIKFNIIIDLVKFFEESDFSNKYMKGELSNFKYLLLLNKYSARSYNDLYQYLIFPLLFMDIQKKIERDLSKPIALNKEPEIYQETLEQIQNNYINFGTHFNTNYSTSGYVLYYLVRMSPFTKGHIKLQSNQFDLPKRMFYSYDSYLNAMATSEENRELIPEFFHNYEAFLNLNYLNLGYIIDEKIIINDLDTGDKNGIAEFIIKLRQELEKVNILPWVDNIFGFYQDVKNCSNNSEIYNAFPSSGYEKNNNFEKKKISLVELGKNKSEIINDIKTDLSLLSVGMIPVQIIKLPSNQKKMAKIISVRKESNSKGINKKSFESNFIKDIQNFLKSKLEEKSKLFLLDDNYGQKLIIKTKEILHIFHLFNNENKNNITKIELWKKNQIRLNPLSKMVCELTPDIFISCRYIDKFIQLNFSDKKKNLIYHENIITSVELLSHEENEKAKNIISHSNKIIFGDEIGYLYIMKIEYKITSKKQTDFEKIKMLKNIRAHNSLIKGIIYSQRLNIIISYSEEGQITINNGFDLTIINIIELGNDIDIKDIKISEYDLIYIYCTDKVNEKISFIKCYSLNGIKFTELSTEKKIINYFLKETIIIVYENDLIESFNLYELEGFPLYNLDLKNKEDIINKKEKKNIDESETNKNRKIIFCILGNSDNKLIIIYDDNQVKIEDVSSLILKK